MDKFEIGRTLARGSFGQVIVVTHVQDRTVSVMKMIPITAVHSPNTDGKNGPPAQTATELEVQLLQTLHHPNIVAYHDSFIDGDSLCIVMEYCEQGDLYTHLQEEANQGGSETWSSIAESKITAWFIQICWALDQLHGKNILHRDLKTQNIFLQGNQQKKTFVLKLGDFGVAKVLSSSIDLAQTQIGTPFYMAPEVFKNKPYSYASDMWGVGCVLYEMLTRNRAFDAQSLNGLALKVMRGKYTPIAPSACSPQMHQLVKSLFSQEPEHRPTLKELLCSPFVRKQLRTTMRSVVQESPPEQQDAADEILRKQIINMGMGPCIGIDRQSDQGSTMEKLEVVKSARAKEQKSLELLERQSSELMATVLNLPPPEPVKHFEVKPIFVSDRDRVLYFRDLGKQTAVKRFESEAKGIREEARYAREMVSKRSQFNTGSSADMWNALGQIAPRQEEEENDNNPPNSQREYLMEEPCNDHTSARDPYRDDWLPVHGRGMPLSRIAEQSPRTQDATEGDQDLPDFEPIPIGPQREVARPVVSPASQRPLAPLLWYAHIHEENIQNPFSQINPKVVHSPVTKLRPGKKGGVQDRQHVLDSGPGQKGGGLDRWCADSLASSNKDFMDEYSPGQNGGTSDRWHANGMAASDEDRLDDYPTKWSNVSSEDEWSDGEYDKDYPGLQATLQAEKVNREIDQKQSIIAKQDMALESLYFDLDPAGLGDTYTHPRYRELEYLCIKGLGERLFEEALAAYRNGYPGDEEVKQKVEDCLGDRRGFISLFEQMHHLDLR
eukprot:GEMP01012289.1.p1 GENE.GEMP01012289.1~~GEMP01012289.1.p1  ORF type:complete len:779 (+),score=171.01 GEMP01012289.1:170-2506(+)